MCSSPPFTLGKKRGEGKKALKLPGLTWLVSSVTWWKRKANSPCAAVYLHSGQCLRNSRNLFRFNWCIDHGAAKASGQVCIYWFDPKVQSKGQFLWNDWISHCMYFKSLVLFADFCLEGNRCASGFSSLEIYFRCSLFLHLSPFVIHDSESVACKSMAFT